MGRRLFDEVDVDPGEVEGPGVAFDTCPTPDDLAAARTALTDLSTWVEPRSLDDQMALVADRATSPAASTPPR